MARRGWRRRRRPAPSRLAGARHPGWPRCWTFAQGCCRSLTVDLLGGGRPRASGYAGRRGGALRGVSVFGRMGSEKGGRPPALSLSLSLSFSLSLSLSLFNPFLCRAARRAAPSFALTHSRLKRRRVLPHPAGALPCTHLALALRTDAHSASFHPTPIAPPPPAASFSTLHTLPQPWRTASTSPRPRRVREREFGSAHTCTSRGRAPARRRERRGGASHRRGVRSARCVFDCRSPLLSHPTPPLSTP